MDPLNHANNAVFNTYFEEARINFVQNVPELANGFKEGKSFVLAKCTIEYLKPVRYPSTMLVGSGCLSIGNSSIEAVQAMFCKETKTLHAVATTKGVWFDLQTQRPTRVPEIADLEKFMVQK
jgi:acyl-CoA thioester hydrolase